MRNYNFVIKPVSNQCNYRCDYCVYVDGNKENPDDASCVMSEQTTANLIRIALDAPDAEELTFAFQGGEPTLAGIDYFYFFATLVSMWKKPEQSIIYTLQTNGSNLNDEWCAYLKELNFLVGISLDGFQEMHDQHRVTQDRSGTFNDAMRAIGLLRKYEIDFNILTVVNKDVANHATELYEFYRRNNFEYIQLLPCLAEDEGVEGPYALSPSLFASFHNELFDAWCVDYSAGVYRSINLFDNAIALLSGIVPLQCGILGFCSPQFIVAADGTVTPCDYHVQNETAIGNVNQHSVTQLLKNEMMETFLHEPKRMSPLCSTCPFVTMCNGNCKRQNISYFDDTLCGYQEFLKYAYPNIRIIVDKLKSGEQSVMS
ncbi:MAG: SPASM domain-containing protein [Erysipelotrichales bacterium]|nr:MAG: SPASM domain-containing protein [Erysipelotrichales bacterium]